jgi:hypothetical protein
MLITEERKMSERAHIELLRILGRGYTPTHLRSWTDIIKTMFALTFNRSKEMFNTKQEIFKALAEGNKIRHETEDHNFIHMVNGNLVDQDGNEVNYKFTTPSKWSVFTRVTLNRYWYKTPTGEIKCTQTTLSFEKKVAEWKNSANYTLLASDEIDSKEF